MSEMNEKLGKKRYNRQKALRERKPAHLAMDDSNCVVMAIGASVVDAGPRILLLKHPELSSRPTKTIRENATGRRTPQPARDRRREGKIAAKLDKNIPCNGLVDRELLEVEVLAQEHASK